ncbi:hypothetical protein MBGDN05_00686 [Thermoplasmatales archaeon SCGC AB-539-N05]|nr:hypothetical protein MBGDN05_00686 [Thermoplasmatales archaeon SCGC AB-539-N05]
MVEQFYAGHSFDWMNKFLNAIPKKHRLKQSIAFSLAACIHHQFIYTKQSTFKLTHKTLDSFGVNRRSIRPYLTLFQKAGLIDYNVKRGRSPIVELLVLPTDHYIINKKTIKEYIIKGTGVL